MKFKTKCVRVLDGSLKRIGLKRHKEIMSPNESINAKISSVYVAIPKTGSTSIRAQVKAPPGYLFPYPHMDIRELRLIYATYELTRELGRSGKTISQERLSYSDVIKNANNSFDSYFKFSFVRNPWARAVSLYFRKQGEQVRDDMSFSEFVQRHFFAHDTCTVSTKHVNQIDWLVDEQGLAVDFVGKIEELDCEAKKIYEMTNGRIVLNNINANRNRESKSREYRSMYDGNLRNIIERRFEKDINFFGYEF